MAIMKEDAFKARLMEIHAILCENGNILEEEEEEEEIKKLSIFV